MADVHVEVIKYPEKKKFFGLIGGCDAEVKVAMMTARERKRPTLQKRAMKKRLILLKSRHRRSL